MSNTMKSCGPCKSMANNVVISNARWWASFALITIAAFATRLYKIELPNYVCWDETHFGKFGSWYINRTFFFDVHPPLGKMLIGLSGYLTGYNGTFGFLKPGHNYEDYPILGMRIFCAILGTLIVPSSYVIVWNFTRSLTAAILASAMLLFDNGMVTISQYILLDPIMLIFIASSMVGVAMFRSQSGKPFQLGWWFWLTWTGLFLACAISVKFVGLFVVILVGLFTLSDLWQILGDTSQSLLSFGKHFVARVFCLIVLPIALYVFFFWVHLTVLHRSGNGEIHFSTPFQSTLEGNPLFNASMPRHVAYGATITLRNQQSMGPYLHSYNKTFPAEVGAPHQQVTGFPEEAQKNNWRIKKYDEESVPNAGPIEFVQNGDLIRLEHIGSGCNLHSHDVKAALTPKHSQVTCYGKYGMGDANDIFRIEFVSGKDGDRLEAVQTSFRLVHVLSGCVLSTHHKQLPSWGRYHFEVTCLPHWLKKTSKTLWNVEQNIFPRLPNETVSGMSFWKKFMESHAVMFKINGELTPEEDEILSLPWQWPLNYRGQLFSGVNHIVYLLGNPIIWWLNISLIPVYALICAIIMMRRQRRCTESAFVEAENAKFLSASLWLFIGWALHYLPFFFMGRVLYFHHYFPAALFSSMLSAVIIDYLLTVIPVMLVNIINVRGQENEWAKWIFHFIYGTLLAAFAYSFYLFSPIVYGFVKSEDDVMQSLRWLASWDF